MSNYSPVVNEYYDSKSLTKDSLTSIVKNLFIIPASYNCTPDFKTLIVQPQDQNCKVIITINEKLKSDNNSSTDNYTTTIEYLLDPSYKIISEKSPGT
jgi:polyphosphate kinase